jgi:hypothetical protein
LRSSKRCTQPVRPAARLLARIGHRSGPEQLPVAGVLLIAEHLLAIALLHPAAAHHQRGLARLCGLRDLRGVDDTVTTTRYGGQQRAGVFVVRLVEELGACWTIRPERTTTPSAA